MPGWLVVFIAVAAVGAMLAALPWLAARARRGTLGGSPLTPFDEIWHPAAHRARIDIEVQAERSAPAPSPGDPPRAADGTKPDGPRKYPSKR